MKDNCSKKFWSGRAAHSIFWGTVVAFGMLVVSGIASGQDKKDDTTLSAVQSPAAPALITPPAGNSAYLAAHGVGTQGYVCLPTGTGVSWTVNNARPEATLFSNIFGAAVQIITHFLSPVVNPNGIGPNPPRFADVTWQSSFDSSRVWAQKENFIHAGTDPNSCPNTGSIDCLLLQVIGSDEGPTGGKLLTKTTFIQRLNTKGGSAPIDSCLTPAEIGKQILVPYSADYIFFRADQ